MVKNSFRRFAIKRLSCKSLIMMTRGLLILLNAKLTNITYSKTELKKPKKNMKIDILLNLN